MTDVRRRRAPLRVEREASAPDPAPDVIDLDPPRERTADDRRRFESAIGGLRTGGQLGLSERTLMVLGGVLAPVGLVLVVLGWVGASRTPFVFEQVPYLISGGLLGLGLVFLGAFLYFAHWLTELVREQRTQSAALLAAIGQLRDDLGGLPPAVRPAPAPAGAAALVTTSRGSMVHRPDCVVVVGKPDVRAVDAVDGRNPCKLCDPFDESPSVN